MLHTQWRVQANLDGFQQIIDGRENGDVKKSLPNNSTLRTHSETKKKKEKEKKKMKMKMCCHYLSGCLIFAFTSSF